MQPARIPSSAAIAHRILAFALVTCVTLSASVASEAVVDASGKQPRVAIAADGTVHLVYAAGQDLVTRASRDGGATFTAPVTIGRLDGMMVGMRRGPQLASGLALVVAAIGKAGDLQAWRSADGGATWKGPVTVNEQPASAREGLFSLAAGPGGAVWATWLDMRTDKTELYAAWTKADGSWGANAMIYRSPAGSVCECCQPMIAGDAGSVAIMWRNQLGGARDLFACILDGKGAIIAPPAKLGSGTWRLDGCPMDGGGIALLGARIETVWRREEKLYASASPGLAKEADLGPGRNASVAIQASRAIRVWQRGDDVHLALGSEPATVIGRGRFPVVATRSDGTGAAVVTWEADDGVHVRSIPLLPRR